MKKFFLVLILCFVFQLSCLAKTGVTFLYINGSNNNDLKMKNWYENGVKKLHHCLKKSFEEDLQSQKYFLKDGQYFINEQPIIFFWGDKSHEDLKFVEKNLALSKGFSPLLAYHIRSLTTHFLHDAIWIQKYHNMSPVLDDLHQSVMDETKKGNKVVLYGYSAGSFVTYEYLLTRLPYINVSEFFNNVNAPKEEIKFVKENPQKNTCINALGQELAVFSAAGHIVPNDDDASFKKDYLHLDALTDKYCIPKDSVKGIVNFASPLVLFYSDMSDPNYQFTYYNRLLFKYIIENDMFWLTINYREDPFGFPGGRNLSIEEISGLTNLNINPHLGFIYDQSDIKGKTMVFKAHTSYWGASRKNFSKAVVQAYINGYKHQYDDSNEPKIIDIKIKKLNIRP